MPNPIAIFYHCLFVGGQPPELMIPALRIVTEQMDELKHFGMLDAATEMVVGVNGGQESEAFVREIIPEKATVVYHGLNSFSENLTLVELEKWLPTHRDYYVFYFHAKGATAPYGDFNRTRWRGCMMRNLVGGWKRCVGELDRGYDSVGCHWLTPPKTPPGQNIWAGNFWWAKASFLNTLPSILKRDRILISGIGSVESRYESEVWIGNGPRLPRVVDLHMGWDTSRLDTCVP